ncbi:hypothetical protein WQE_46344 [Paraburkholderia hospita]|uniref:Fis family transcriptional regulator n=1 Tax=Paraburkholderia hospita TaxID=169430 RepID=A0ABP2PBT8_9BURK|nr:hypothetical protein WQE_46344 [Paraburkholderia hospita]
MAKPAPNYRSANTSGMRRRKAALLPLPRTDADRLALPVHTALDALRRGQGNANAVATLMEVSILTSLLARSGFEPEIFEQLESADRSIRTMLERGVNTGSWFIEEGNFPQFAKIVTTYDRQLRNVPVSVFSQANQRLVAIRNSVLKRGNPESS